MKLIEKIASALSLVGIPMGRLDPHNLIADVCGSFVQADELAKHGVVIPSRIMSTAEFRAAAKEYVGLDLVSEVLDEQVHPGVKILEHSKLLALHMIESAQDHPEYFEKAIGRITADIVDTQKRLLR